MKRVLLVLMLASCAPAVDEAPDAGANGDPDAGTADAGTVDAGTVDAGTAARADAGDDAGASAAPDAGTDAGTPSGYAPIDGGVFLVGGAPRRASVFVPSAYDPAVPAPFVMLLHGYGFTGAGLDGLLAFRAFADAEGFIYARPEGTADSEGSQFWNATAACCDVEGSGVDDSAYLRAVVDEARAIANIDATRIYVVGHSNGGFMAQRLACDHADLFAAVISIAGATTEGACAPSEGIAVLEVHGDDDDTIAYGGGSLGPGRAYPGAVASIASWAERNACGTAPVDGDDFDLETLAGDETRVARYAECSAGGAAELWTVTGGGHVPYVGAPYLPALFGFLQSHAR